MKTDNIIQALKTYKHKHTPDCQELVRVKSTLGLVSPSVIASESNSRRARLCNNMGDGIWLNWKTGEGGGGECESVCVLVCVC